VSPTQSADGPKSGYSPRPKLDVGEGVGVGVGVGAAP
jgi:hypothetical protein